LKEFAKVENSGFGTGALNNYIKEIENLEKIFMK